MAARYVLTTLLAVAFMLAGLIQYQITAALSKFSAADHADYVLEDGYVTLFCKDVLPTEKVDSLEEEGSGNGSGDGVGAEDEHPGNGSDWTRYIPYSKVNLTETKRWEHNLYESFIWGSLVGPLIGAYLAYRLGPKRVIEGGLLGASVATLLVPAAWFTTSHYALSVTQGTCTSMIWPAAHVFTAKWYPPAEWTAVVSFYSAWTTGWAVAVLFAGPLAEALGRDSVFYFTSLLIAIWYIAWQKYASDAPALHPIMSWAERSLITTGSDEQANSSLEAQAPCCQKPRFPIRAFLFSGPMWACAIASFGYHWGQTTLLLAATKYLQIVYGFSMSYDGTLSYLPFLGHFLCGVTLGTLADHYRGQEYVSTTTVRKILVYISHFLPGAIIFVFGYTGCDPSAPAALFVAAMGLSGAMPTGVYTSALEICPRYAGAVLGFVQSIGASGALAACYVVREGLYGGLPGTWTLVFGVCFTVMVVSAGLFLIFGSGTDQRWIDPPDPVGTLLTMEQTNSNDITDQQIDHHQSSEVIDQLNGKNHIFTT